VLDEFGREVTESERLSALEAEAVRERERAARAAREAAPRVRKAWEEPEPEAAPAAGSSSAPAELDEEAAMAQLLGFGGFESTKGTLVKDNVSSAARGAVRKVVVKKYRQYMNRRGGQTRALVSVQALQAH